MAQAAPTPPGNWYTEFKPFTLEHLVVAVLLTTAIAAIALIGRRLPSASEQRMRRAAVVTMWVFVVIYNAYYLWPSRFDLSEGLPLQPCDVAVIIAPIALGTRARWARSMLYFWGLLLSSQAFVTPTLSAGPVSPRFWLFWIGHTLIIGSAVYEIVALRYRPTFRDLRFSAAISILYVGVVSAINIPFGLNYGFIGDSTPGAPTLVDKLGPWPLRVLWMTLIALAIQTLGWAVWLLGGDPSRRAENR